MKPACILIADDQEFVRRSLGSVMLAWRPEWQIAAEASNGTDAMRLAESLKPTSPYSISRWPSAMVLK